MKSVTMPVPVHPGGFSIQDELGDWNTAVLIKFSVSLVLYVWEHKPQFSSFGTVFQCGAVTQTNRELSAVFDCLDIAHTIWHMQYRFWSRDGDYIAVPAWLLSSGSTAFSRSCKHVWVLQTPASPAKPQSWPRIGFMYARCGILCSRLQL